MTDKKIDIVGTELSVGDWVVRSYLSGRSPSMKFGRITKLDKTIAVIGIKRYISRLQDGESTFRAVSDSSIGKVQGGHCMLVPDSWVPEDVKIAYENWRLLKKKPNDYPAP